MLFFRLKRVRLYRKSILRWSLAALLLVVALSSLEVLSIHSTLTRNPVIHTAKPGRQRIFIASIHWNNEDILKSHWISAVVALARELGPENVFISIQESGSWDKSKAVLRELDQQLADDRIPRRIVLSETTHLDEISRMPDEEGWIDTPRGKTELRRIPYLARLRNEVLQPLYELQNSSRPFDKILFLNDVVFRSSDVRALLSTRGGDYAAACALDFVKPPAFYDTFALRDSEGHEAVMQEWPYFRSRASRAALIRGEPVPVTSCWNGMVAMKAESFYQDPRLSFRGVPDGLAKSHVEGSECCLIHTDNPMTPVHGVWLNPNVRVGYSSRAYEDMNLGSSSNRASLYSVARGLWMNRLLRWFTTPWFKEAVIRYLVSEWEGLTSSRETGVPCLINEMQVLVANGWAHV